MRKFWFENETGERISLQSDSLFLNLPEGLGFAKEREYAQTEYGFCEVADEQFAPSSISGVLVFKRKPYQTYREVTNWLAQAQALKLVYVPYGTAEHYKDIVIDVLNKSELTPVRTLETPIQITGLTPWYSRYPLVFAFTEAPQDNYKRYGFRYGYQYTVTGTPGRIDLGRIQGHFGGGVSLYADGPLAAPVLTLKNTDTGEVYGKLDLSAITIEEGERLIYSSRVRGAGVYRKNSAGETDLIESVELYAGIPMYMRAPVGVPLTATLDVENIISTQSTLYIDEYWETR